MFVFEKGFSVLWNTFCYATQIWGIRGVVHGYRSQDGSTAQKSIAYFHIPDHLAARGNQ